MSNGWPSRPGPAVPAALLPQTHTVPSSRSATTCSRPPCRSTTSVSPATGPGTSLACVVPVPSCPNPFPPQVHGTPPGETTAVVTATWAFAGPGATKPSSPRVAAPASARRVSPQHVTTAPSARVAADTMHWPRTRHPLNGGCLRSPRWPGVAVALLPSARTGSTRSSDPDVASGLGAPSAVVGGRWPLTPKPGCSSPGCPQRCGRSPSWPTGRRTPGSRARPASSHRRARCRAAPRRESAHPRTDRVRSAVRDRLAADAVADQAVCRHRGRLDQDGRRDLGHVDEPFDPVTLERAIDF